jgi:hypothetical protein
MRIRPFATAFATFILTMACDGVTPPSSVPGIAGSYRASEFTTTRSGITTDQFADGVTLTLTLAADGATTGVLFVPARVAGADATIAMDGSWTMTDSTLHFQQSAESFVAHVPFRVGRDLLTSDTVYHGAVIHLALTRVGPARS